MVQKSTHVKFKKIWTFPIPVEKRIANVVDELAGNWLHAPVGISKLNRGTFAKNPRVDMLTLDIDESVKPDIVHDIFDMQSHPKIKKIIKKHGGFDGVISDPVWIVEELITIQCPECKHKFEKNITKKKGLSYDVRRNLSFSVRQVLKPGGIWIFNGLWNGQVKGLKLTSSKKFHEIEIPWQSYTSFRNLSLLCYFKKINKNIITEIQDNDQKKINDKKTKYRQKNKKSKKSRS